MVEQKVTAIFTVKGLNKTLSSFERIGKTVRKAGADVLRFGGTLAALGGGLLFTVKKFATLGGEIDGIERGFQSLAGGIGQANELLSAMDKALDGTVSRLDLMRNANQAILLGLPASAKEMAELANVAQRLGVAIGRDATLAFQDLVTGIGRQSRMILDNLGIIVNTELAYKTFAKTLGRTVEQLTDAEKKQAFYNATLDSARAKVASLGPEILTPAQAIARLDAQFKNLINSLALTLAKLPSLKTLTDDIVGTFNEWADWLDKNPQRIEQFFTSLVDLTRKVAEAVIKFVPLMLRVFQFIVENAQTIIRVFAAWKGAQIGGQIGSLFGIPGRIIGTVIGGTIGGFSPDIWG